MSQDAAGLVTWHASTAENSQSRPRRGVTSQTSQSRRGIFLQNTSCSITARVTDRHANDSLTHTHAQNLKHSSLIRAQRLVGQINSDRLRTLRAESDSTLHSAASAAACTPPHGTGRFFSPHLTRKEHQMLTKSRLGVNDGVINQSLTNRCEDSICGKGRC